MALLGTRQGVPVGRRLAMLAAHFPNLKDWHKTSDESRSYNCVAWAADDDTRNWWPSVGGITGGNYWPPGVPHERTVAAFIQAFALIGYEPCNDGDPEPDVEKVAIYASAVGVTHTARQMQDGCWTSKLGRDIDITHKTVGDLEDGTYGLVIQYLSRPITAIRPPRLAQSN